MDARQLRARQAPLKERYREDPGAAVLTLRAEGRIDPGAFVCKVETGPGGRGGRAARGGRGGTAWRRARGTCSWRRSSPARG